VWEEIGRNGHLVDPLDTLTTLVWPEHDWPAGERVSIRGEEQALKDAETRRARRSQT